MDIQPTKEHLEIIKEIGSKWVIGLATMNGALFVLLASNYGKEDNLYLNIAMMLSGIGIVLSACIGSNMNEMFLKYYNKSIYLKKEENDIKLYNKKIELFNYSSVFCLISSGTLLFFSFKTVTWLITLGIFFCIISCFIVVINLLHLLFNNQQKSIIECIWSLIILLISLIALSITIWFAYKLFNIYYEISEFEKYKIMLCGIF